MRGYLRLISVTPRSHVADIQISDGNGNSLIHFRGWEELCERVPPEYHQFILRPSEQYLTRELPVELLGNPTTPVAASVATDVPFNIFEHNQELWLKTLAHVVLSPVEREEWLEMQGATNRRVEWLFGRAAAKEATRRFLIKHHQARWTNADIPIWPDDSGKPHPLGPWSEHTSTKIDLSITHTSKLIIAAVAANARIGIDIEILGRVLSEDFTRGVFTHEDWNWPPTRVKPRSQSCASGVPRRPSPKRWHRHPLQSARPAYHGHRRGDRLASDRTAWSVAGALQTIEGTQKPHLHHTL